MLINTKINFTSRNTISSHQICNFSSSFRIFFSCFFFSLSSFYSYNSKVSVLLLFISFFLSFSLINRYDFYSSSITSSSVDFMQNMHHIPRNVPNITRPAIMMRVAMGLRECAVTPAVCVCGHNYIARTNHSDGART